MIVGFVGSGAVSGEGIGNLTGDAGIGGSAGTAVQLAGVTAALIAGVVAARREYRGKQLVRR